MAAASTEAVASTRVGSLGILRHVRAKRQCPQRGAPRGPALHQRSDMARFLGDATEQCALVLPIVRHGLTTFDLGRSNLFRDIGRGRVGVEQRNVAPTCDRF